MSETRVHPETGAKLTRGVRPFTVRYAGRERTVDLPGWYPAKKGAEGVHVGGDMDVIDRALIELKAEIQGVLKCARSACALSYRSARLAKSWAAVRGHFKNTNWVRYLSVVQ